MELPQLPPLDATALAALQAYAFPGNVRELENILERAATLSDGEHITIADLQLRPPAALPQAQSAAALGAKMRSEERRVGTESVGTCKARWSAFSTKKKKKTKN